MMFKRSVQLNPKLQQTGYRVRTMTVFSQAFGDGLLSTLDANTALERFNRNAAASSHTRRSGSDGDRLGSGPVSRLPLNKTLAAGQKFGTVIRLMHIPRRQEEEHRLAEQMATRQGRRSNMGLDFSNPSHLNMEIQAGQHSKILAGGIKLLRRYPAGEGATAVGNALPKLKISR